MAVFKLFNPHLRIFELSCRTGMGLDAWCDWLLSFAADKNQSKEA